MCPCAEGPNENKMSDAGQERASLAVEVWKSSQKWNAQRSASLLANAFGVRSIAWLGLSRGQTLISFVRCPTVSAESPLRKFQSAPSSVSETGPEALGKAW